MTCNIQIICKLSINWKTVLNYPDHNHSKGPGYKIKIKNWPLKLCAEQNLSAQRFCIWPHTKIALKINWLQGHVYSGWDSNPHGHSCPKDFKSFVSTIPPPEPEKRNRLEYSSPFSIGGAENGIRTRDPHLGKVMLYHWAISAKKIERETGFGPATPTLARWCSTTELFPQIGAQRYTFFQTMQDALEKEPLLSRDYSRRGKAARGS